MNCEQANSIDLAEILDRLGFKPQKQIGKETQFISPFRPFEKKGSFFLSSKGWYDHGAGVGSSTVVDFAMHYLQSQSKPSSVSECLKFIKSLGFGGGVTSPLIKDVQDHYKPDKESDLLFIREKPVSHPVIFKYLNERGISNELISKYCVEVDYKNSSLNKVFFAIGWKNADSGYEIRSASSKHSFKSSLIAKNFSFIKGNGAGDSINVFEGMMDMLSLLMLLKTQSLNGDCIILNSLSSAKKTIEFINSNNYKSVHLWIDNDDAGEKMVARFQNELNGETSDESYRYAPHKDISLALQAQIRQEYMFDLSM